MDTPQQPCALCRRSVSGLTRHHLVPRTRHSNRRNRRTFTREEVRRVVWLCKPCHRHLHAVLTEKQLEREYPGVEQLLQHPEIAKFVAWIQGRPDGTTVAVRRSNRRARR